MNKAKLLLPLLLLSCLTTAVLAGVIATKPMQFTAKLKVIGDITLWSDALCTIPISSFDYGEFNEGEQKAKEIYVRNDGNGPVTVSWRISEPAWTLDGFGFWYELVESGLTRWVAEDLTGTWKPNTPSASIGVGSKLSTGIVLIEDSAVAGVPVTFTVVFEASN